MPEAFYTLQMIEWDDKYSIGISMIDEAHKKLIDIINMAIVAKEKNYNSEKIQQVLNEMAEYANKDFSIDEDSMTDFNFPKYQIYRNELMEFMNSTIGSYNNLMMDNYHITNEILEYLKQWFVNHIQENDRRHIKSFKKTF